MTRFVYGWGINDANYVTRWCPIYQCWVNMIKRCHSLKFQAIRPTYVGCKVVERWKYFMTFRSWYLEQNPKSGGQLDKDLLGDGKLYSPETCCFVSRQLNLLFTDAAAARGKWPQGVYYHKQTGKYRARICIKGQQGDIGRFNTPEEASAAYLKAKVTYVEEFLAEFPQPSKVAAGVWRKMKELIEKETL